MSFHKPSPEMSKIDKAHSTAHVFYYSQDKNDGKLTGGKYDNPDVVAWS